MLALSYPTYSIFSVGNHNCNAVHTILLFYAENAGIAIEERFQRNSESSGYDGNDRGVRVASKTLGTAMNGRKHDTSASKKRNDEMEAFNERQSVPTSDSRGLNDGMEGFNERQDVSNSDSRGLDDGMEGFNKRQIVNDSNSEGVDEEHMVKKALKTVMKQRRGVEKQNDQREGMRQNDGGGCTRCGR